jgi:hypothetical protein
MAGLYYNGAMRSVTIRLPEPLSAEIEAEARRRNMTRSAVVRERLERGRTRSRSEEAPQIADLVGSIDGLPADLSERKEEYLKATYGRKRAR